MAGWWFQTWMDVFVHFIYGMSSETHWRTLHIFEDGYCTKQLEMSWCFNGFYRMWNVCFVIDTRHEDDSGVSVAHAKVIPGPPPLPGISRDRNFSGNSRWASTDFNSWALRWQCPASLRCHYNPPKKNPNRWDCWHNTHPNMIWIKPDHWFWTGQVCFMNERPSAPVKVNWVSWNWKWPCGKCPDGPSTLIMASPLEVWSKSWVESLTPPCCCRKL